MKLFIASDIHGSAYWNDLMLEKFNTEGCDYLVLLGDILYHGPRNDLPRDYNPKSVISRLNPYSNKILCVKGNCESEVDSMVLDFNVQSEYLTIFDGSIVICATHGHREVPKTADSQILLCGHTHVPLCEARDNYQYINPGSVALPKESSPNSYIIYEKGKFTWHNLIDGRCYMEYTCGTALSSSNR